MAKAVWVASRSRPMEPKYLAGVYSSRKRMLADVESNYEDVFVFYDIKGKPWQATATHPTIGALILHFERIKLDNWKM